MSNPQIENGYTRISNELLEAVLRAKLYPTETKVIFAIMRLTYGWSKKEAQISYGALSKAISCDRNNVMRACKYLERDRVLNIARGEGRFKTNVVSINKNYSQWVGRQAVDNFKKVVSSSTPEVVSSSTPENTKSGVQFDTKSGVQFDTPLKKERNGLKKAERKQDSAVDKKEEKAKNQKQNLARLLKGHESEIASKNPSNLVILLKEAGFEITRAWGAIVQARAKSNPAGFLISILADPKYQIADSAYEQAKLEMRKLKYV